MTMTRIPAAFAARSPGRVSSMATQHVGDTFSLDAASW
jgi:hypothetical protein